MSSASEHLSGHEDEPRPSLAEVVISPEKQLVDALEKYVFKDTTITLNTRPLDRHRPELTQKMYRFLNERMRIENDRHLQRGEATVPVLPADEVEQNLTYISTLLRDTSSTTFPAVYNSHLRHYVAVVNMFAEDYEDQINWTNYLNRALRQVHEPEENFHPLAPFMADIIIAYGMTLDADPESHVPGYGV